MKKSKDTNNKKSRLPYGEGSIYYVDSRERYAGQITLIVDGEKIRKTVYGKSEKVVKDKLRELSIQAKAGNLHLPESKQKKPV